MILIVCIAAGLGMRTVSGRLLKGLSAVRLRGEAILLTLLALQAAIPLLRVEGQAAKLAFWVWLATFPLLIGVSWMNREMPGVILVGLGLLLNLTVVALNGGMPVAATAALAARPDLSRLTIPSTDFVHVIANGSTRALWLADVIPLPGPAWLRSAVSAGDCLLFAGVAAFVARAEGHTRETAGLSS